MALTTPNYGAIPDPLEDNPYDLVAGEDYDDGDES